jgi:hypothetical protein
MIPKENKNFQKNLSSTKTAKFEKAMLYKACTIDRNSSKKTAEEENEIKETK